MILALIVAIVIILILASLVVFLIREQAQQNSGFRMSVDEKDHKIYEVAILKEISDRIGYSLDIQKIVDIVSDSLNQFIDYSSISYMLISGDKVNFKIHLEQSVTHEYIETIKKSMCNSLSTLSQKKLAQEGIEQVITGAIVVDEITTTVGSHFHVPLVIKDQVIGVLSIAHVDAQQYTNISEMSVLYRIIREATESVGRLQEVVKNEQQRINAMVQSITDGLIMVDNQYRIITANNAAKHMIHVPGHQDVTIFDYITYFQKSFKLREKLEESLRLDRELSVNNVVVDKTFYEITITPVKEYSELEEKQKVIGGVVIFHDVSDQIELGRLREDFTSMLVHELRSPIDGIKKIAEVLQNKEVAGEHKELFENSINIIYEDSSNMLKLVGNILDIAKIETNRFNISKQPNDIWQIIKNRVQFYEFSAEKSGIDLSGKVARNVPDSLLMDPYAIKQVINNLVSNALKFTTKGSVKVQAFIHHKGEILTDEARGAGLEVLVPMHDLVFENMDCKKMLVVMVTDTGIGISRSDAGDLFNKYKQLQSAKSIAIQRGSGLGLAVSKGIVEAHEGIIDVVSSPGVGSIFYFALPITHE